MLYPTRDRIRYHAEREPNLQYPTVLTFSTLIHGLRKVDRIFGINCTLALVAIEIP